MEARAIVRQAMAILTPAVPARMEDGHQMLTHWTRKIIVEEGHTVPQLVHILHLIVQHFRVRENKMQAWSEWLISTEISNQFETNFQYVCSMAQLTEHIYFQTIYTKHSIYIYSALLSK